MNTKAADSDAVIQCDGLHFAYNGDPVLTDVTFSIAPRDFVSVVGPNGGGKTTLLRLILGLLNPQRGTIHVLGKSPEQVRPLVGYVPQHFIFDMHFPIRVIDVVLMGRLRGVSRLGRYSKDDQQAALAALGEVEMDSFARRHIAELSGGQRQRVLIARALASDPKLMLLDEPTAHVDTVTQTELMNILTGLNQRMTVLMVTHDAAFVSPYVKSVLCVNRKASIHPTDQLTGEMIMDIYGDDVRYVRHDHPRWDAHQGESSHE
ncbi:MAG: ABC transporter ATP-binding protein [candidate division Zixibacteria bacterium]|nr:ABC transporter ATP-binding protein [candidate division Zixibacteria bacterium]